MPTFPEDDGPMAGFPPPADERVRFADGSFMAWPQLRWSFSHMEQLVPTKSAWRGPGPARELPTAAHPLALDLGDLEGSHTDALAVLHRGEVVLERYLGACGPHDRHALMSCNKSMVGTIAECLILDGTLDGSALVPTIIPELTDSAWGDATVRQVLDMTIDMVFHEDYLDPGSDVWRFLRSSGMIPAPPGDTSAISDVLPTIGRGESSHGNTFAYREPNIFVLGWIVRRVANRDLTALASDLVWRHLGAEHDWLYMVDSSGAETTALATLRDFLRFGQLIAQGGVIDGVEILPPPVAESIMAGGDREAFGRGGYDTLPGWSYRSQWWIRHVGDRICPVARGAYGQVLYVDPANDLVVARFGSSPEAPSALLDPVIWPMMDAITAEVVSR